MSSCSCHSRAPQQNKRKSRRIAGKSPVTMKQAFRALIAILVGLYAHTKPLLSPQNENEIGWATTRSSAKNHAFFYTFAGYCVGFSDYTQKGTLDPHTTYIYTHTPTHPPTHTHSRTLWSPLYICRRRGSSSLPRSGSDQMMRPS